MANESASATRLAASPRVQGLLLAGILVSFFDAGISGLCLGFIAGRSIQSLSYPLIVGRFLGLSRYSQVKGALRPAFVTLLLFPLAAALGRFLMVYGWVGLVFSVGATMGAVSVLAFYAGLSGDQRKRTLQRVRQLMPSRG